MLKKNRLNPNAESRATLLELDTKGILHRERVGLRNVIRAATSTVELIGFDLDALHGPVWRNPALPNFAPGALTVSGWVGYNNGRARITAHKGMQPFKAT
jgi:hypothetical protein